MRFAGLKWTYIPDPRINESQTVPLPFTIGRLPGNDIILKQPGGGVSREHARIVWEENKPVLYDLHSTNGTIIDGHRSERFDLRSGSRIKIGNYEISFVLLVRCQRYNCRRLICDEDTFCPWCGQFSADAATRHGQVGRLSS